MTGIFSAKPFKWARGPTLPFLSYFPYLQKASPLLCASTYCNSPIECSATFSKMVPVAIVPVAKVAIKAATVIGKTLFGASTIVGAVTKYGITFYIFGKVCQGCIYIAAVSRDALFSLAPLTWLK